MNYKALLNSIFLGSMLFAAFSSSTNYQLKSYAIGPGGTNTAQSSTYNAEASVGEQANGTTSSHNYAAQNGSIPTAQLNIPPAPTLSNGSGTYYDKLLLVVNTGGNPSDSTYAVAVSSNNFANVSYVQVDGTLGSAPFYQSYMAWGGSSGSYIVGLATSTTYEVKVAAMEGMFTNTNFGSYATSSTVAPSIAFSVSSNALNLGNLLPGAIMSSPELSVNFTTNANVGGSVYVSGLNQGLKSATTNYIIPTVSGNLASVNKGFGLQVLNPSQSSGGPLSINSSYNLSGNNVGADLSTPQQVLTSTSPIVNGSALLSTVAKASSNSPSAADYQEVLTVIGAANF